MTQRPIQVVVLDDVCRFAWHVLHYLSESVGFGIGNIPYHGDRTLPGDGSGSLITPGGEAEVCWINVDHEGWQKALAGVWARIGKDPCCFLVDVRGSNRSARFGYSLESVADVLVFRPDRRRRIFLVSSYYTGEREIAPWGVLQIHAKSAKVLGQLLGPREAASPAWSPGNVLVTGAGFECKTEKEQTRHLGMPKTRELLLRAWRDLKYRVDPPHDDDAFPVPRFDHETEERCARRVVELRKAADAGDLDAYWNEALGLVLDHHLGQGGQGPTRERKLEASREERRIREAFRQALLASDWGHLNQALDAARLPWLAWLSTNYTGFADRAIALLRRYGETQDWRVVSTSHEAIHLARHLRHGAARLPVLFKLYGHGDHLLTMAIAGEDKEIYSSLSLPVDNLLEVYSSAEIYLERSIPAGSKEDPVFWHVVGHSLGDALLRELLERVFRQRADRRHVVLSVRPADDGRRSGSVRPAGAGFFPIDLEARQYLARLRRFGEPPVKDDDFARWLEEMQAGG